MMMLEKRTRKEKSGKEDHQEFGRDAPARFLGPVFDDNIQAGEDLNTLIVSRGSDQTV